ncbi:hypothetical protein J9317_12760 [Metabacillus sp. KIGAM252]|uniref:Uncharacterized protein n=1 Tax=Metabacillus flavus TaxID=2823519 RepID=A0ABS5LG16_9BACI|nr:hypothetical protein [Metabacillus flavus]MBS2969637.1 hypothetical protein [Metabacillus flavus]
MHQFLLKLLRAGIRAKGILTIQAQGTMEFIFLPGIQILQVVELGHLVKEKERENN